MSICVNAHCLMLEVLRNIALNALNTVQKIKAMSKMLKIDKVHIRGVRKAMYVEDVKDVKDGKRTYTHILAHNFLNTKWIFNPKKVLES